MNKLNKTELLVWDRPSGSFVKAPVIDKFLKGPVPWNWIADAAKLGGRALEVGLCLWRLSGVKKSKTVRLGNREVAALGVDRYAKSRALKSLQEAGLVDVIHARGRLSKVTILE